MFKLLVSVSGLSLIIVVATSCSRSASSNNAQVPATTGQSNVVWRDEGTKVDGQTIRVGFRVTEPRDSTWLEPVVSVTREGQPVPDAMVFCRLISSDGGTELGEEVATIYETPTAAEPACYVAGKLPAPASGEAAVRVRVVLAGSNLDWSQDVRP